MSRRRNAQPLAGQRRRDLVTRSGGGGGGGTETRSWGGPSAVPLADARTLIHSRRNTTLATAALASQPAPSLQPRASSLPPPSSIEHVPLVPETCPVRLSGHSPHASAICSLCSTIPLRSVFILYFLLLSGPSLVKELRCNKLHDCHSGSSTLSTPFLPSRTPPLTPSSSHKRPSATSTRLIGIAIAGAA